MLWDAITYACPRNLLLVPKSSYDLPCGDRKKLPTELSDDILGAFSSMKTFASVTRVSIGSDNGLSPIRRQAIILTNAGILLIGSLGTNFSEILIKIHTSSLKISSGKWRPFCLDHNVLIRHEQQTFSLCEGNPLVHSPRYILLIKGQ